MAVGRHRAGNGRERANQTRTTNNLKRIALAAVQYQNGSYFPGRPRW